jgi:hypothetical protein
VNDARQFAIGAPAHVGNGTTNIFVPRNITLNIVDMLVSLRRLRQPNSIEAEDFVASVGQLGTNRSPQ